MKTYNISWNHPKNCSTIHVTGDLVHAICALIREGPLPFKDYTELTIIEVEEDPQPVREENIPTAEKSEGSI